MFESCRAYVMAANLHDSLVLETAAHHLGFGEVICGLGGSARGGRSATTITYFFLDYRMRDEELVDMIAAIREERSSRLCYSPIILLTADRAAETVLRYVRFGFDDVISLPARRDELADRLADQLHAERVYIETKDYFGPDRRRLDRGAELRLGISHQAGVRARSPPRHQGVASRGPRPPFQGAAGAPYALHGQTVRPAPRLGRLTIEMQRCASAVIPAKAPAQVVVVPHPPTPSFGAVW